MTRFAWLQSRVQTLAAAGALAAIAVVAVITGLQLAHLYSSYVTGCQALGDCSGAIERYLSHDAFLQDAFGFLLRIVPALLGAFWGAPLVARELETGTFRLAWTQSVSRSRWLLTKLALGGVVTIVAAGVLTLTVTWWFRGIDIVSANQYSVFDVRDIVPIAYAAFAFALGAFAGAVIRRTVPAMAATLAAFAFTRIAFTAWVRPHLFPPLQKVNSLLPGAGLGFMSSNGGSVDMVVRGPDMANAWVQSTYLVTSSGHVASFAERTAFLQQHCPGIVRPLIPLPSGATRAPADPSVFTACQRQVAAAFHTVTNYQPPSRFWAFQWTEFGIFLALAVLAAVGCLWWVTRRIS